MCVCVCVFYRSISPATRRVTHSPLTSLPRYPATSLPNRIIILFFPCKNPVRQIDTHVETQVNRSSLLPHPSLANQVQVQFNSLVKLIQVDSRPVNSIRNWISSTETACKTVEWQRRTEQLRYRRRCSATGSRRMRCNCHHLQRLNGLLISKCLSSFQHWEQLNSWANSERITSNSDRIKWCTSPSTWIIRFLFH